MTPVAKPDTTSKSVAGIAYAVLLGVVLWVGVTVKNNELALVRVQTNQKHILMKQEKLERRISQLEHERKPQ